jgi:maltooligosyltrehalose trehalohydrolase
MASGDLRAGAFIDNGGVVFRVYAPERERVSVALYGPDGESVIDTFELKKNTDGFFEGTRAGLGRGALYKLELDGAGPFPDPLSRSQPLGVHGPSEVIDHGFAWSDDPWKGVPLEGLVVYEVHVGTATKEGTFEALIEKLPYFRSLGVTALEIMPVASFPGRRNWGYDGVGLYAPAAVYGGPEGLKKLINAAHAEGLAVILDVVYNHLGPDGNYFPATSRHYFTDRVKTPWGAAWDLDGERSAPVREVMLANAEMWVRDYHADGLRLDATHAIFDSSEPHILQEIAARARAAGSGRQVLVMAEDDRNDVRLITPVEKGGLGLDGLWADDFHHQLRRAFAGDRDGYYSDYEGSPRHIAETLRGGWFYRGQESAFQKKPRGTAPEAAAPAQFIHCIQNHDQIGNRALGDRIGASVSPEAHRAMAALLLLSPYTPLLFMGQEWDASSPFLYFTDHAAELGRAVTEGRRQEFQHFEAFKNVEIPDPQADATFERSKLLWDEQGDPAKGGVLAWYRELLRLRATHPAMQDRSRESFHVTEIGEGGVVLERRGRSASLFVVVNIAGSLDWELALGGGSARVLAWSGEERFGGQAGAASPLSDARGRIQMNSPGAVLVEAAR